MNQEDKPYDYEKSYSGNWCVYPVGSDDAVVTLTDGSEENRQLAEKIADLLNGEAHQSTVRGMFEKTDWRQMAKSKDYLVTLIQSGLLREDLKDNLEGLLHWIDALQDFAVDRLGMEEQVVFAGIKGGDD
jgi:hypothetical protein